METPLEFEGNLTNIHACQPNNDYMDSSNLPRLGFDDLLKSCWKWNISRVKKTIPCLLNTQPQES